MTNIHPTASIHPTATIGKRVIIAPHVVVCANAWIQDDARLGERVVVCEGARVPRFSNVGDGRVVDAWETFTN